MEYRLPVNFKMQKTINTNVDYHVSQVLWSVMAYSLHSFVILVIWYIPIPQKQQVPLLFASYAIPSPACVNPARA